MVKRDHKLQLKWGRSFEFRMSLMITGDSREPVMVSVSQDIEQTIFSYVWSSLIHDLWSCDIEINGAYLLLTTKFIQQRVLEILSSNIFSFDLWHLDFKINDDYLLYLGLLVYQVWCLSRKWKDNTLSAYQPIGIGYKPTFSKTEGGGV